MFHYEVPGFSGGFVGVDVFFVISGYLITRLIKEEMERSQFSFFDFYGRRARRILPALFATLAATLVAAFIVYAPEDYRSLGKSVLWTLGFASNVFFYRDAGYFDVEAIYKPLLHTWSLSVEEQFYFIWPFLLFILMRIRPRLAPILCLAIGLGSLYLCVRYAHARSTTFYLLPFRAHEFAIGAGLVWLSPPNRLAGAFVLVGVSMVVVAATTFSANLAFPYLYALLPSVGAGLIIYFGQRSSLATAVLGNSLATYIGRISYSLYLAHWPIYVFYRYHNGPSDTLLTKAQLAAAAIAVAALSYHFLETPFRRKRESIRWIPQFAVILAVLGGAIVLSDGVQFRLALLGNGAAASLQPPVYGGEECTPRCESNADSNQVVYVIGDSHVRAYYAGLKAQYPEINFIVFEYGGCEFYSNRYYGDTMVDVPACMRMRRMAWEEIAGTSHPVIVGQHWYANFTETQVSQLGLPSLKFTEFAPYVDFVVKELALLRSHVNGRIVVVGGVPKFTIYAGGYATTPYRCATRPMLRAGCAETPRTGSIQAQHDQINSLFRALLPDTIEFADPFAALCDQKSCQNYDGAGKPAYSDSAHLSIEGSKYIVARLARTFAIGDVRPSTSTN